MWAERRYGHIRHYLYRTIYQGLLPNKAADIAGILWGAGEIDRADKVVNSTDLDNRRPGEGTVLARYRG